MLFEGIENEKERIYKEKRKLNPVFIELIENTLDIYRGIFAVMCRKKENQLSVSKVKRVDRKASLMAYYDLVMDEGIFIEEQTYVMLMNFFAHCEKILRINLNPENWKDMKWDEIIDNQINEENKITCHLRNKIRSC